MNEITELGLFLYAVSYLESDSRIYDILSWENI